ncbi:Nuclear pore complex protein Nup50 [Paragonimus heterotremus]|uniref:Nuclear pore complex protein Nup50 n=1 Tax=Paragonimus heterotremus TaxID=100268 RepID=A0A8J4T352_9TREM|nr:Nuclear pore complex protein Nup50 [Paragonimus heterotremus]
MSKRRADVELNQDNWDDEVESADAGLFEKADKSSLTVRKILSARPRRSGVQNQGTNGLFKSFTGLCQDPPAGEVRFNFSSNVGLPSNNGTSKPSVISSCSEKVDLEANYLKQLQTLNQNLLEWIEKHIKADPLCILSPIFQDYEKHLKLLHEKYPQHSLPSTAAINTDTTTKIDKPPTDSLINSAPASVSAQTNCIPVATASQPCVFTAPVQSLSFPTVPSVVHASSSAAKPFSFSLPPITSSGSLPPLFKFGTALPNTSPFASSVGTISGNLAPENDDDAEEYQPPKPVVKEINEEGSVFSVRCKLFYKVDSEWRERGVGNLFIKPISNEKFQLLVRADTNLGNILLNVLITKDIPVKVQKNNLTLVCVPSPPLPISHSKQSEDGANVKPVPMLLRVKTEEAAMELLKQFDRHRGVAATA